MLIVLTGKVHTICRVLNMCTRFIALSTLYFVLTLYVFISVCLLDVLHIHSYVHAGKVCDIA